MDIIKEIYCYEEIGNLTYIHDVSVSLCLFRWKTFYKDSFPHFLVFGSIKIKKIGQRKTRIKMRLILYMLFSNFFLENNLSLTQCISPINIIFFWPKKKIFSFTLLAFLTINSLTSSPPFVFSLFSHPHYHPLWPLLFLLILSLSTFLLFFLPISSPLYNTVL